MVIWLLVQVEFRRKCGLGLHQQSAGIAGKPQLYALTTLLPHDIEVIGGNKHLGSLFRK